MKAPSGLSNVIAIAAGGWHDLALRSDGSVVAWGYDESGSTDVPAGLSNVVAIAAGSAHSLALTAEGEVVAWGYDRWGSTAVPGGLSGVAAVAAGLDDSLVLAADGWVAAWGFDWWGQTDVPLEVAYSANNVVAIAAGGEHCLALVGQAPIPTLRLELSRGTSVLELRAYGAPGISCQLLRASQLPGPWLPTQAVTFTNSVQLVHLGDTSASAQFFRLLRK